MFKTLIFTILITIVSIACFGHLVPEWFDWSLTIDHLQPYSAIFATITVIVLLIIFGFIVAISIFAAILLVLFVITISLFVTGLSVFWPIILLAIIMFLLVKEGKTTAY